MTMRAFLFLSAAIALTQSACYKMNFDRGINSSVLNNQTGAGTTGATGATSTTTGTSAGTSAGTSTTTPGTTGSVPLAGNYTSLYSNVFAPKCISCHSGPAPSGNYDMSTYASTISGGHVVSFSPTTSPLYLRTNDKSMPPGAPLTTAEIQAIYTWIANGANNDGPAVTPSPTPTPVPLAATFTSINANILTKSCLSCHNSMNAADGYSVSTYAATLKRIVPGNASGSGMYQAISSNSMPPGAPLTTSEKQIIQTWINNGALNN